MEFHQILSFYPNPIFLAGFGPWTHFLTPKGGTGELKMEQDLTYFYGRFTLRKRDKSLKPCVLSVILKQ